MELKEAIKKRKTIRAYQDKDIPENIIKEILNAARLAPSARNSQPWRFYVIKEKLTKEKLREQVAIKNDIFYDAPIIIVCASNPEAYKIFVPEWDLKNEEYALIDISLSSQNMVLMAQGLGIGSCIVANIKPDKFKNVLSIPDKYLIPYIITLGYPKNDEPFKPKKELSEIYEYK